MESEGHPGHWHLLQQANLEQSAGRRGLPGGSTNRSDYERFAAGTQARVRAADDISRRDVRL